MKDAMEPTDSPSLGPLEPCVGRIEAHKAEMSRTLLNMAILSFFMGVSLCTCVSCCLWCISARVGYTAEDGVTSTFDSQLLRERVSHLRDFIAGPRNGGIELASQRRTRYTRLPTEQGRPLKKRTQSRKSKKVSQRRVPVIETKIDNDDYLVDDEDDDDEEVAV